MLFRLGVLSLFGFAILNGLMIWHFRRTIFEGYTDFASFYTAGKIVSNGQAARLYDPPLQWQIQQQFAGNVTIRRGPLPYVRPPFEALLFAPLSWLPYPVAFVVWLVFKLVLLLMALLLLPLPSAVGWGGRLYLSRAILCLAFFPVGLDLFEGQDSILLLLILALVLRLLLRGADLPAGAILALGLVKFHIIIPLLLVLALQKRLKTVVGFLATASALFVLSVTMVHWSGVSDYGRYLWRLNQTSGLGMATPQNMPNVRGILTTLMSPPPPAHWLLLGVAVFGIGLAATSWRMNDRRSIVPAFSFSIVVILVTSYYSYSYDLTLLLVPLLLLGESLVSPKGGDWRRSVFLAASALLLFTPLYWILVLKVNQASWIALLLVAFGVPIYAYRETQKSYGSLDQSRS